MNNRRDFLGNTLGIGTGSLLAGLGLAGYAAAQSSAPAAGGAAAAPGTPGARPPRPPEPAFSQAPPLKDLKGKVAYVTAASDGIGLGIARAASNAGMKVVIGYRNEERLKAALPLFKPGNAGVMAFKHDVTDRDGWTAMVEAVKSKYGKLHLVVNNAGIKTLRQASQAKFEEWDNAVAVNFTAIYNSVAACLPHMLEHGEGGHFVTTASMGGLLPGVNAGVYTSTKIAAVGLMEALRVELERTNIGTGVFCPGGVNTDNYVGMDQPNPFRKPPPGMSAADQARMAAAMARMGAVSMSPLEAGERVMNGVVNNDLFILSHPEFGPGMKERFDAIMASTPAIETPIPPERSAYEAGVMHCGIYPREIAHREPKRSSYRTV
ncbi:MAG TPA: SDR family oxidoreductase [Steroidobacteraceae bacterium]|jgi:NAD(P)-dependent dehydrogenase (short-subunit alcohol dehydrogenase family)|nr:SDR family oxidoreductase [Steroidobacteraceae bacterium]